MPNIKSLLLILLCALLTSGLHAQNLGFLKRGAVTYLTGEDEALLKSAFDRALNQAADKETVTWSNPDTGASGELKLLDTHEDFGTTCRSLRVVTRAGGYEGGGKYRLCRAEDGSWRFAPLRVETP